MTLAHRQPSVLDLSSAGPQPTMSRSGFFVLVFNAETYNHIEIRCGLVQERNLLSWLGESDAETLQEEIDCWRLE